MDDGSLKFELKEGEITGIFINAGLDHIYERLFRNAQRNVRRNPDKIVQGIKVIVFGCFWIEACCNYRLQYFIDTWIRKEKFGVYIWKTIKRANIIDKFSILRAFANENQLKIYEELIPRTRKVFDLRNRLAHFKDQDIEIAGSVDANEAIQSLISAPEPELIQELKGLKIKNHAESIAKSRNWINSVYKRYSKGKSYSINKLPNNL